MTGTEINNWQIRINVFGNTNHVMEITEAIENLKLGYDIRLLNIDKNEGEIDDETQIFCKSCGRLDGALHDYVCDACLILEKEKRQQEEDTKYDDDKYEIEWGWVIFCNTCNQPAKYQHGDWFCPDSACPNNYHELDSLAATEFHAEQVTKDELIELQKTSPHAEWD